jgi:tripeptide aminopeptidase
MDSLLDRFCRYVRVDTQAVVGASSYPSSPGQLELGRLLLAELKALGLADAVQDAHGLVFATVPGNVPGAPTVAFLAHVDTSPETTGRDVKPLVHTDYDGRDIVLPGDPSKVLRVADNPELARLKGKTIITTDGTTLLGADDKAGVAVIMELVAYLTAHPEVRHGAVRVCFTCDEEVGHGVDHLDPAVLAARVAYTLDGGGAGEVDAETFSADLATVTVRGVNIHPSIAKGRMTNAVRLAGLFLDRLPRTSLAPEATEGRDGFVHPLSVEGDVSAVTMRFLLRDFVTANLGRQADLLRAIGRLIEAEYPAAKVEVVVTEQYRNMADGLAREPRAVPLALEATRRAGLEPKASIIRGGTDGSLLTAKGVPTPNLSTGEHNPHSPLEWTCLEEMQSAVRVLVELVKLWADER